MRTLPTVAASVWVRACVWCFWLGTDDPHCVAEVSGGWGGSTKRRSVTAHTARRRLLGKSAMLPAGRQGERLGWSRDLRRRGGWPAVTGAATVRRPATVLAVGWGMRTGEVTERAGQRWRTVSGTAALLCIPALGGASEKIGAGPCGLEYASVLLALLNSPWSMNGRLVVG